MSQTVSTARVARACSPFRRLDHDNGGRAPRPLEQGLLAGCKVVGRWRKAMAATMGPAAIAKQLGVARSSVYRLLEPAAADTQH
jgi:hypothetical protein